MVSTFTPNIQLEEPARGDQVGTWDTPVNNNMTLLDLIAGSVTAIALNNSPVVLSAAQFKSATITFNSTLTGSCAITFPTSFRKAYSVGNFCTGPSTTFFVTLQTTAAGGQVIAIPPGEYVDVINDGSNMFFKNLDRVGSFRDFVNFPWWVTACTVPPYLNCDGSAFSSAVYPQLAQILGGTTLPDSRGRVRATLNQGTGRMTSAGGGVDGNTNLSGGGAETWTLTTAQIPSHSHGVTDPGHFHQLPYQAILGGGGAGPDVSRTGSGNINTVANVTSITIQNTGGGGAHTSMQPSYVAGYTVIRAA